MGEAEEWRIVAEFDDYEVSNTGQVRNRGMGRGTGRVLRPQLGSNGYYHVEMRGQTLSIHKLVATAFLGDSEGRCVDHKDRNQLNNHVSNLRYASVSQNSSNRRSHKGHAYEYIDTLPDGAIAVEEYGRYRFENVYYHDGAFYAFNGVSYRRLYLRHDAKQDTYYVSVRNTLGAWTVISLAKYRRMINDLP
jgi:hypothetical protein